MSIVGSDRRSGKATRRRKSEGEFRFRGPDLSAWSIDVASSQASRPVFRRGAAAWVDPLGSVAIWRSPFPNPVYWLEFAGLLGALIDPQRCRLEARILGGSLSPNTIEHILCDQIAPRIIAHSGSLVLHAAVVARHGRLAAILGPSGAGKSTLSSALHKTGWTLLGDDALVMTALGDQAIGRALYPSLRLLPDSAEAILGDSSRAPAVAQYSRKRNLNDLVAGSSSRVPMPVSMLLFLKQEQPADIRLTRTSSSRACLELLRNSFCLDAGDAVQARDRLTKAAHVARVTPSFELAYPRDYARLPDLCSRVEDESDRVAGEADGDAFLLADA